MSDIQGKTGQLLTRGTGTAQQVGGGGDAYQNQQLMRVTIFLLFGDIFGLSGLLGLQPFVNFSSDLSFDDLVA